MTETELAQLIEQAKAGCNDAKTRLLWQFERFIWQRVNRLCRNRQDRDDYFTMGQLGFLAGIERYDVEKGSLMNYARHWIDHHIRRHKENDALIRLPANENARKRRRAKLGEYDGVAKTDRRRMMYDSTQQLRNVISLDSPLFDSDDAPTIEECIPSSDPGVDVEMQRDQELAQLRRLMSGMSEHYRDALLVSGREYARRHQCSHQNASITERRAMLELKRRYARDVAHPCDGR